MNQPVNEIIKERDSIRKYKLEELRADQLTEVFEILTTENEGPFGNLCRFWLIDSETFRHEPVKLGTYGFLSGIRYLVAGAVVKEARMSMEDYGYVLEKKILKFTRMGLGTCWIGGTFRRSEYAKTTSMTEGEVIPAITPIGVPAEKRGVRERIIKLFARSKTRKEWSALFFDKDPTHPLSPEAAGVFANALEMVRLAPSANNAQPWRMIKEGKQFHFFVARNKLVKDTYKLVDLQRIDMGIALAHFELGLLSEGISGAYEILSRIMAPDGWEYVASYKPFLSE